MGNQNQLYNKEYFQKRDVLSLHLAIILDSHLKNSRVRKVLDVGCGTGQLVKFLEKSGFDAIGCDQSTKACKISGQIKADATSLPFGDGHFDAVLGISLIEHLTKEEGVQFIQETHRVLKKDGLIFLVTPNLFSPMRLLKGKNWFAYSDPTHLTFYTPFSLAHLLKQEGFNHGRFWFKIPQKPPFACPFFNLAGKVPKTITDLVSFLFISTPLALIRDSFWLLAQK